EVEDAMVDRRAGGELANPPPHDGYARIVEQRQSPGHELRLEHAVAVQKEQQRGRGRAPAYLAAQRGRRPLRLEPDDLHPEAGRPRRAAVARARVHVDDLDLSRRERGSLDSLQAARETFPLVASDHDDGEGRGAHRGACSEITTVPSRISDAVARSPAPSDRLGEEVFAPSTIARVRG